MLALLLARATVVDPAPLDSGICRDPGDDKFIACALAAGAVAIVSGDNDLLTVAVDVGVEILSPREFLTKHMGAEQS